MAPPNEEQWYAISERYFQLTNFPNCLGAIDGKHIRIRCPKQAGSLFWNYKSFNSIVLQAVSDADCCFVFIDVGDYGRNSDGGVLKHSGFGKLLASNGLNIPPPTPFPNESSTSTKFPMVFVADEAYPLLLNVLRPYPRRSLDDSKRIFNGRMSRARKSVECAFLDFMLKIQNLREGNSSGAE